MRLALMSLLMMPFAVGCSSGDAEKSSSSNFWGDEGPQPDTGNDIDVDVDVDIEDTGDDIEDTGGDSGTENVIVWEDVRHATSVNFSGAYANDEGLYVVTTEGQTWSYTASSWTNIPLDVDEEDLNGLWGTGSGDSKKMVGVGGNGVIINWDGNGWDVTENGASNFTAVDGPSIDQLIAVGGSGAWSNAGGTWTPLTSAGYKFNDVWYDGTTGVAVGDNGLVGTYLEGEWTFEDSVTDAHLYGVSATHSTDVWAVGQNGTVLHWNGTEWQQLDIDTQANLWSVWCTAGNIAYAVGANGEAYKIEDFSAEPIPTGVSNVLYDITGSSVGNLWAVGSRGLTLRFLGD